MPAGSKPRILLTGAAGRVGRLIAPLLREHFDLRLTDLHGEGMLEGDLADRDFAARATEGVHGVVHLAGLVASEVTFADTLNGNYRAVLAVLDACRGRGVSRFVFASSHHIVGLQPSGRVHDESTPIAPDGFYGLSKAFGEAACAMYAKRFGIRTLVIRIGNADPQVADARRERIWISARDLTQLITIGLHHPALEYEIVYGVSNSPSPLFTNEAATRLGYRPLDNAAESHSPSFRGRSELTEADGFDLVGGRFATDPLP